MYIKFHFVYFVREFIINSTFMICEILTAGELNDWQCEDVSTSDAHWRGFFDTISPRIDYEWILWCDWSSSWCFLRDTSAETTVWFFAGSLLYFCDFLLKKSLRQKELRVIRIVKEVQKRKCRIEKSTFNDKKNKEKDTTLLLLWKKKMKSKSRRVILYRIIQRKEIKIQKQMIEHVSEKDIHDDTKRRNRNESSLIDWLIDSLIFTTSLRLLFTKIQKSNWIPVHYVEKTSFRCSQLQWSLKGKKKKKVQRCVCRSSSLKW